MIPPDSPSRGPRALVLDRSSDVSVRVRRALALLPDGGEVITCSEIGRVEKLLASTPVDVVVAGPTFVNPGGLQRLARLHARAPWLSILLVTAGETEASLAEIVQAGADDVVPLEASDATLAAALTRGHRITHRRFDPAREPARPDGVVVTIASASEGCGKTFLGVNTAAFLARRSGKRVVLVDLDLQFGEVATALRLRAHVTMVDALAAESDGHDLQKHLDDFLLPHPDGFHVLAAPRNPAEADAVEPDDVRRLLALLRTRADYVIVDSPTGLSPLVVAALEATDHLYVLATPDRPSLVNLGLFLHAIDGIGPPVECVTALLNKAEPDMGIDPSEMAGYLPGGFAAVLPYDREVPRSVNLGVPILTGESRSPVSAELIRALTPLLPAGVDKADPRPPSRHLRPPERGSPSSSGRTARRRPSCRRAAAGRPAGGCGVPRGAPCSRGRPGTHPRTPFRGLAGHRRPGTHPRSPL